MSVVVDLLREFFSSDGAKKNIPVLDGPWLPNERLEEMDVVADFPNGLDDAVASPAGGLLVASGKELLHLERGGAGMPTVLCRFPNRICGLGIYEKDGLIVCLDGAGVVIRGGSLDGLAVTEAGGRPIGCAKATTVGPDGAIYIADGSTENGPDRWVHDLMERREAGRLVRYDPKSRRSEVILEGLAYPHGLAWTSDGELLITESWRHRIRKLNPRTGKANSARYVITNLPGYPARIAEAADGGYWLALFAMRTQLIEFVLHEDDYRRDMIATIPPKYWIAPMLYSPDYYLEPLQAGGLKQLGVKKPWAPPRSYGLVAKLDQSFRVRQTWHSRAGRARHGITSVRETAEGPLAVSKGNSIILTIK
jgi:sugar lactone lactonase YvrE